MLAEKGVAISGLGYYPNPLHADAATREAALSTPQEGDHRGGRDGRARRQHLPRAATRR